MLSAALDGTYTTLAPTITSITPTVGPLTGGPATLVGTNFVSPTLTVGGMSVTPTSVTATSIGFTLPAHAAGTVQIVVATVDGSASTTHTYVAAPVVTSLSQSAGPATGGASVTINGTNLSDATGVFFGGTAATGYAVNSATQITATAPAGSGTVDIRVTTAGGTSPTSAADQYTYVAAPTVTGVSPPAGPSTGGASVTINGTNFSNATAVTFGGTAATSFAVNSATQITATAPAGSGTMDIRVTTAGGTSATSTADRYTYVAAPTVTSISHSAGPTSGGATVIITGTGFASAAGGGAVKFGAMVATYIIDSNTQITATSPANFAGTYDITVTTPGGTSATSAADQYTYAAAPTVTSVSPSAGPATGGRSVVITGANFSGTTAVTFGGAAATDFTVNSATQIRATAPPGTGTVDIRVTTPGGVSTAADQFTYVAAPTVTAVSPNTGSTAGGTAVVITGSNFIDVSAVTFGGVPATGATVLNGTQITARAPAGSGTVDVRVTTPGGTSATSTADQFTYVSAPTVTSVSARSGPTAGGTTVTIIGTNFAGTTSVTFGAAPATSYTVNSATEITATAPAGSGTVDIRVTTAGGISAASAAGEFIYAGAPTITSVSPSAGPVAGGTSVTIIGTNFSQATAVTFGASAATAYTIDSGTQITATSPAGSGSVDIRVTTAGGTSATSVADQFTYVIAPAVTNLSQSVSYETAKDIDLSASISGNYYSIAVVSLPVSGTVSLAGDVITYTPLSGYSGPDSFTWSATGIGGTSAVATVTLTVEAPLRPEIDTPTDPVVVPPAAGGAGSVTIDLAAISSGPIDGYRIAAMSQFGVAQVINSASVAPPQARASVAAQAASSYQLVYTPAANFIGEDSVTLVAYGPGGDSVPVTFTFQVAGKAPDLSGEVIAGGSVTFTPTAGLVGGPFQALRVTSAPSFGSVTINGLNFVFAPGSNGGATTFDYVVDLPFGASAAGRVSVASSAMPGSEALVARTLQGVPVTVRLGAVAGGPFTGAAVVSIAPATAGEATIAKVGGDYDLTFVSSGDFSGDVVVTYSLSNAFGATNSTLTVTVDARPDPSLDPEVRGVATGQVTSARRFADAQINNFQRRLRDLHTGTNSSSNGLSLNLGMGGMDADRDPQQALRRQLGQDRALDTGSEREMMSRDIWAGRAQAEPMVKGNSDALNAASAASEEGAARSVGLWTAGSVDWGRQDATGQRDSRVTTHGVTVGLDVKVSDQLIIGGGVGYGEDKTRIGGNGSVTNGKATTGAFYASWHPAEGTYVDGVVGYSDLDFTSRRWVEGLAGQANGYANGDRSGDVRFASVAAGRFLRGEWVVKDFYARLDARDITLDGFTETGGGLSALNWDTIKQKGVSINLGTAWRWSLDSRRYGQFRPAARVEWSRELEDIGAQGVRYADWATSPMYLVPLNAWSRNAINLDLGTEWSVSDHMMLSLGYRGALGDASTSHGAQIGLKYGW